MKLHTLRITHIVLACFFLIGLSVSPAHTQALSSLDRITEAVHLAEDGDLDAARAALGGDDDDAFALSARGALLLAAGNVSESEPLFRASVGKDAHGVLALWGLSLCALSRREVFTADTLADRAALLAPTDPRISTLQAYINYQLGRIRDASAAGKAALDGGEKSAWLMSVLAQTHYTLGYTDKAVEFGGFAEQYLPIAPTGLLLPLSLPIADSPAAFSVSLSATDTSLPLSVPTTDSVPPTLTQRLMAISQPSPHPFALSTTVGGWCLKQRLLMPAIHSFERAAACDTVDGKALNTLLALYRHRGYHPLSASGNLWQGKASDKRKRVALTFDDGPNPLYTPMILSLLAQHDAHATFFLVGKMVKKYPDLARDLLAGGHELANHTYNHSNLTTLTPTEITREVLQNRVLIHAVTGRDTFLFRPPGGAIDGEVAKRLRALDYNVIYWSINAGEFVKYTPEKATELMLAKVKDGSILLLHNGPVDHTPDILPLLLPGLAKQGYDCVTVSELAKAVE